MVSFISAEIKYFTRAEDLSFFRPTDDTRGKPDYSSSPRLLLQEENRSSELQAEAVEVWCVTPGLERKSSEGYTQKGQQ